MLSYDGRGSEEDPKVLVMHDDQLETLWALGVKQKGVTPDVVSWIVQKLDEAGYRGMAITIKTDQEEAIMALTQRRLQPDVRPGQL